ncbi:SET and MYND domain-containing protein 4-like [Aphidius gifuensis]|uniref:SET and MYND domain-containing protein 4-like n=1 Tax=Aphidius gifuensis TaxID=684658 RepID=UPI001CDCA829|nr:SET and MYND domain-containing protein 4-like [Aphidius gifuensis]
MSIPGDAIRTAERLFSKTKTFEDKIEVAWNSIVGPYFEENSDKIDKKVSYSKLWREIGNKVYTTAKNEDYLRKSIEAYTKSIAYAPVGSEELSLAYANRSAVLFRARLYEDCLLDIERSLEAGYPDNLKTKLYVRQALCFKALKPNSKLETDIPMASAKQWLPNLKKNNPNYNIKDEFLKMMNQLEEPRDTNIVKFTPIIKNNNSIIAGGSDAIKLKKTNENKQYIVTTRDIKSGEFIYINKPFEMSTCDDKRYNTCWHCCRQTLAGVPCDKCPSIVFCSQECKDIAWNEYHDLECQLLNFSMKLEMSIGDDWQFQLTIKILSKALKTAGGIDELNKKINDVDSMKDKSMIYTDGIFEFNTIDNFHRLDYCKQTYDECSLPRVVRILETVLMFGLETNIFGQKMEIAEIYSNKQSTILGGLILRYFMIVKHNVVYCNDDISKGESLVHAIIMPFKHMLVQNCDPHVNWYSYESNVAVLAERPIKKGEKICVSSVGCYQHVTLSERRIKMALSNLPPCKCPACVQDLPLMEYLPSYKSLNLSNKIQREFDRFMVKLADYLELIDEGDAEKLLKIKDTLAEMSNKFYQHVTLPCQEASVFSQLLRFMYHQLSIPRCII